MTAPCYVVTCDTVAELLLQQRGIVDCLEDPGCLKEDSADYTASYVVVGLILGIVILMVWELGLSGCVG